MIEKSRNLESALGNGKKIVQKNELNTVILQRRSIRVKKDLKKGEILKKNTRLHCGENENSVADLTGVAVQDIQIAKAVFKECGK